MQQLVARAARAAKALVAAGSAASAAAGQALVGDQTITLWEWATIGGAAVGAFLLVYGTTNAPKPPPGDHAVDQGD